MRVIATIQGCDIIEDDDGRICFTADADIDADGSPHAYHPDNRSGLDALANARNGQEWCGIVTRNGEPVEQALGDPAPGFYISPTALQLQQFDKFDPRRYIDSENVPFIVVPPVIIRAVAGIVMGCRARITHTQSGKTAAAVVADVGPRSKIGELSIAAAKAIGVPSSPRVGGEERKIILYELWPDVPAFVAGLEYPLQGSNA